jgi:hypothetical protein
MVTFLAVIDWNTNMADKPLTENCEICGKKIHLDRGFGWGDIGSPERPEMSVHVECMGLGGFMEKLQDDINAKLKKHLSH